MDAPRPMSTIPTSVPTLGECSEGIILVESKGYHAQILHQGHPTLTHGAHHKGDQGHPEDRQQERDYKEIFGGGSCGLEESARNNTMLAFGNHMAKEPGNGELDVGMVHRSHL